MESGRNMFTVDTSGSSSPYHISGTVWNSDYSLSSKSWGNCFKISGNTVTAPGLPLRSLTDYNSNPVNIEFMSYDCETTIPSGSDIADIGNGLYDTIPNSGSAGGGGESSINNY